MIGIAMYTTIITLHKQGNSCRAISRLTGHNRKTIGKIVKSYREEGNELPTEYKRKSKLHDWHQEIVNYLEHNLSVVRIKEELNNLGYEGSYTSLTRYINKLKISKDICIRFHTLPGEEAQVDFGDIGMRYDQSGKLRKAYIFNMRLSYSRKDYYEVVFDQKVETWIRCHINAFNYFGGVPTAVKLDNLKAAILVANFYEPVYQRQYKSFADHYNFLPAPCRVRQPQEKGKVESGIKYICNNFFAGRKFDSFAQTKSALDEWLEYKCNSRIHGTTRVRPNDLFNDKEANMLKPLPAVQFNMSSWHTRKVGKDCHINLDNSYYSVPYKYALEQVEISMDEHLVKIYFKDALLCVHTRANVKGTFSTNRSHYPEHKLYYPESDEYKAKCTIDMQAIGHNGALMLEFLRLKENKDWSRTAKGILSLRKSYSNEILDKACKRALYYEACSYSKIKEIIKNNCYDLPLPEEGGDYARAV
jgi:transposase